MFEKRQIEDLLRINGVPPTSPDEEIKSFLLSAQWHENDVEAALLVLKENVKNHKTHIDTLQKVFSSDEKMKPNTIADLLGVDIDITNTNFAKHWKRPRRSVTPVQAIQISLLSILFSVLFTLGAMWYLDMGVFHFTMQ